MVEGALTVCPLRGRRLRLLLLPLDLCFLGAISNSLAARCSGAAGRGAGRLEGEDFCGEVAAMFGSVWGFWRFLAKCRLKAQFFSTVVVGLNNKRGGEKLLFQSSRVVFWGYSEDERSFGGLFGLKIRLVIFSGLVSPKKGGFRVDSLVSIICIITLVIFRVIIFSLHATVLRSLSPYLWDLDLRLGGAAGYVASTTYFSNLKSKEDYRLM
jgi:hypothetical protein